jgi:hypothetical protein
MRQFIATCFAWIALISTASADTLPAPSDWKNQRGSELHIDKVETGKISGFFINHAADFDCKDAKEIVVGKVLDGGNIIFGTTFPACLTLVSWTGSIQGNTITTNWLLYYVKGDGTFDTLQSSDVFTQQ